MKGILKKLVLRPITVCTIVIIVMVLGILGTGSMAVNMMPNMNMPFLGIAVAYPGASAEVVEDEVSSVLEENIRTVSDIKTLTTYSYDNASVITIQFDYGSDLDKKQSEIEQKLKLITLPSGCYDPIFSTVDFNATAVATMTLHRADGDIDQIVEDAKQLSQLFYGVDGVGQVKIVGSPIHKVELKSLEGLDISILMVAQALQNESLDIPLGSIITNGNSASIKNESSATTIDELKEVPVKLELSSSAWTALETLNTTIQEYEESTPEELQDYISQAKDARDFIKEIDDMSATEVEDLSENLTSMRSIMTLVRENTDTTLKIMWNQIIKPLANDPDFLNATEEDLEKIAKQYDISVDTLKTLQEWAIDGTLETKWNIIVDFRKNNPEEEIEYIKFADLFIDLDIIDDYDPTSPDAQQEKEDIAKACELADNVNTLAFDSIIESKEENEKISDEQYASLFVGSRFASDFPAVASPQFINIIRQNSFDQNCEAILNFKNTHLNEDGTPSSLSNEQIIELYNTLIFEEELGIEPTLDLVTLIRKIDFEKVNYSDDDTGYLVLKLDDLCKVYPVTKYDTYAEYNGSFSIMIEIYTKSGANTTTTVNKVKDIINDNPTESMILLLDDQSDDIMTSIMSVVEAMILGGILAIIVLFVFLKRVRTSIIISITMPLSILAALLCLYLNGTTINLVTLGGLAVGIGMLVDNSIVVIECISKRREAGETIYDACINGTSEVGGSLVASTLTTIIVFVPILFTTGLTKEIFQDLAWAVIFSISFSLIVSVLVIPTLYCLVYRKEMNKEKLGEKVEFTETKVEKKGLVYSIENKYAKILSKILKKPLMIVLIALITFISSISLVFATGMEFLPPDDQGLIEVNINYDLSTSLEEAHEDAIEVRNILNQNVENIEYISIVVGTSSILSTAPYSTLTLQMNDKAKDSNSIAEDIRELLKNNPYKVAVTPIDGIVETFTSGMIAGVSLTLKGPDMDELLAIYDEAYPELIKIDGVSKVYHDASEFSNEYIIKIDRTLCAEYDIDYQIVVAMLRAGIAGHDIAEMKMNGKDLTDIHVQFNKNTLQNIDTISNILIGVNDDGPVKLKDVATIKETTKQSVIVKQDKDYILNITFETHNVDMGGASSSIYKVLDPIIAKHKGYDYVESGVNSYLTEAFDGLIVALIAAFFLLFGVMACQFESLSKPGIVIVSIPFSFTGGFLGIVLAGQNLNVVSFIGLIMLMGVIVNDAIVLIDKIDMLKEEGMHPYEAIVEAGRNRLRPILMTSLTTILALIPLALGFGEGAALMQPMGVVVIGGLTLGTLITLVLIPSFYCIVTKTKYPGYIKKTRKIKKENSI